MYNLTDMHLHTRFSRDARQKMEELAKKAADGGMTHICLTEHMDFMDDHHHNYTKFRYNEWKTAGAAAKNIFPGLLMGIEAGEIHLFNDRYQGFLEGKEIDFVLGSVHSIGDVTPVFDGYFDGRDIEEAYKRYLEEEYRLIKHGGFDSAAHMTLVHRQGAKFFKKPVYETFRPEIDDMLKELISKKIALEVNTSGLFRFESGAFIPDIDTIKAYLRLGGDLITVGSDGHKLNDSFSGVREAYEMLDGLGVKEVTVFKKRKPVKIKTRK